MKRILTALAALTFPLLATAGTHGILKDNQALVIVQGNDGDAQKLYDALDVEAVESNGRFTKTFSISSGSGEQIFNILCNWSPLANVGSCTLKFLPWRYSPVDSEINTSDKYVLLQSGDKFTANSIIENFIVPQSGQIFSSENSQLRIWINRNSTGEVTRFSIQFDN